MDINAFLSTAATGGLNATILIVFVIVVCAVIGVGFFYYFREKRFKEYTVLIWYRDGFGQLQQTIDYGGVYVDQKTNNKRLFLKFADVGLSADNIPFIMGNKGKKYIYLYRNGLKNFFYIKPTVNVDSVTLHVGEEDVNWAVNSYERAKKLFTASTLLQYMPFIALAFVSIIIMIIFIYFFKDFKVLKEAAQALAQASQYLAAANSGTTVIPAG